jgi:carboxyl-terminal processing protease
LLVLLWSSAAPGLVQAQDLGQAQSLAGLCKVWGLLKYLHPAPASRTNWDDVLVAYVGRFKTATNKKAFNQEVVNLVGEAGLAYVFRELSVGLPRDAATLGAAFRWIDDATVFEAETRVLLKAIAASHRPVTNVYVSAATGGGHPDFSHDTGQYARGSPYPSEYARLLALARFWNMVQYFAPNRDIMDRDWTAQLTSLVPQFVAADSATAYNLAVAAMTAGIDDAHAFTGSATLTAYWGVNSLPLRLRLVEGRTVVVQVYPALLGGADVRLGDVVTHIAGVPVETMRAAMRPYVNGSNDASRERNIHSNMVRTNAARLAVTILRGGPASTTVELDCPSLATVSAQAAAADTVTSAILPGNVGYVHMGLLQVADVAAVMAQMKNTRALVLDIRNYPNGTLYAVSNYLNSTAKPFVKFLQPDLDYPGSFKWRDVLLAGPNSPNSWNPELTASYTYSGKVVVLQNQETQSQAEYTVMAFQTAPGAVVVGSQTAGADGNVSLIQLPGDIYTYFSGLGVYYPDGRNAQRTGIVPDVYAAPTINGLRAGRDEVLEAALQVIK